MSMIRSTEKLEDIADWLSQRKEKGLNIIGTHSGAFHCDEALAVAMLTSLPEMAPYGVVRSRNSEIHEAADILVDVGGIFDEEKKRFDHHQGSFHGTFSADHTVRLSSAGLVYKYYGRRVLEVLGQKHGEEKLDIDYLYPRLYDSFFKAIDGIDNGVEQCVISGLNEESKEAIKLVRNYKISTDLSARVGRLNPAWNSPITDPSAQFEKACQMTYSELEEHFLSLVKIILPARDIVRQAYEARKEVHESGKIMRMETPCPWREPLFELEEAKGDKVLFVLYPDQSGKWRVQAVPEALGSFRNRLSLKKEWQGVRDADLAKISGVEDAIFVHATGFIGGAQSYEGVMKMALLTLETQKN